MAAPSCVAVVSRASPFRPRGGDPLALGGSAAVLADWCVRMLRPKKSPLVEGRAGGVGWGGV